MILAAVQPSYLAWIPFFARMKMADAFVYLDDDEFSKNSFHNRNRIKTRAGELLLTAAVNYKGNSRTAIKDIPLANNIPWRKKHWKTIQQNYNKAPYFNELKSFLTNYYETEWQTLGEMNIEFIEFFRAYVGIDIPCYCSSKLNAEGRNNVKLINLCKQLGATKFVVKPGTESYHPRELFLKNDITFEYFNYEQNTYPQLYGNFIPHLSILDFAMNCGPNNF